jgi:hypothetical protein
MPDFESYVRQVRELLELSKQVLTPSQVDEVEHLIRHGERAEGLHTLAWIIVEENLQVSADIVNDIRALSEGLIDPDQLPPNLESQIERA